MRRNASVLWRPYDAQRLTDAKDKQQQLKTEVASAAQAYKHYKNTLGETDSATIAAKANLDAYKGEYRAAVQEVKKSPRPPSAN